MKYLGPTRHPRLNEAVAVVFLIAGLFLLLSLASYHPLDPSWNTVTGAAKVENLTGRAGAFLSDFLLQAFGFGAYAIPLLILMLGFKWIQSSSIEAPFIKTLGSLLLVGSTCAMSGLAPNWHPIATLIPAGGLAGAVVADYLVSTMNITGAVLLTAACWIVSLYLVSTFEMSRLAVWFRGPIGWMRAIAARWSAWRAQRRAIARERAEKRAVKKALAQQEALKNIEKEAPRTTMIIEPPPPAKSSRRAKDVEAPIVDPLAPPFDLDETPTIEDIPIHQLEFAPSAPEPIEIPAAAAPVLSERASRHALHPPKHRTDFHVPPTDLLQEPPARSAFDSQELKEIAAQHQIEIRRIQRPRLGDADQSRTRRDHLRVQARSRREIFAHHHAQRGSVPRPASRIDSDRAHSRQADRRHRSAQLQARSHQPAPDSGIRRIPQLRLAADHRAGQGYQRADQGSRARYHAAPADRRFHRIGQERDAQFADHVDPVQGHAAPGPHDHGRSQAPGIRAV